MAYWGAMHRCGIEREHFERGRTHASVARLRSVPVGTTSLPKIATLTNTSNSALTVRDISASGIDFAETNTCPSTLPAGGSCATEVTFKPAIDDPRMGTIMISTSDPASPQFLVLTGTGQ